MSVINRMLQELESRHEQPQDRLPGIVRAVPPPARSSRKFLLLVAFGIVLLATAGVAAWQVLAPAPQAHTATGAVAPVANAPAAAPPADAPPSAEAAPAWPQPLQAPTESLVSEAALAPHAAAPAPAPRPPVKAASGAPSSAASTPVEPSPAPVSVAKATPETAPKTVQDAPPGAIKQVSPAQRADQRYREALALLAQGRMADAQGALEETLRTDARHLGARQALLGILVDGKRFGQAEQLLQEGLALNLAPASMAMALARLQMERGDQGAALATLDRYLAQGQGSADYHAFLAALLQRAERHGEAVAHYQAALRLQPNRAVWWMGLGISLQADKRAAEAEQAFARARALPGLNAELLAFVEQRLKQLQQAR